MREIFPAFSGNVEQWLGKFITKLTDIIDKRDARIAALEERVKLLEGGE